MTTKMTPIQIIDETINYYTKEGNKRAIENKVCMYNTKDGEHCAVGRCLLPKYQKQGINLRGNGVDLHALASIHGFGGDGINKMLQMKYRGQSLALWENLQLIHDTKPYWYKNKNGLTKKGLAYVKELKKEIKNHL